MRTKHYLYAIGLMLIGAVVVYLCFPTGKDKQHQADDGTATFLPYDYTSGNLQYLPEERDTAAMKVSFVNLDQPINQLSLQDLRLLRSAVYAQYGFLFMDADLRGYFTATTSWYDSLMYARWEHDEMSGFTDPDAGITTIELSEKEAAFVAEIDRRMAALKQDDYIDKNGFRLANIENVVNLFQFQKISKGFSEKLSDNNFVIVPGKHEQLFHVYEENDYRQVPNFITTDLMLQAFHMYFSYMLKTLEQKQFVGLLTELSLGLYTESFRLYRQETGEMKNLAAYNSVFYAIPYYLLTGKQPQLPDGYKALFDEEIAHILSEEDVPSNFLSYDAGFPYSQFKPRGHYTRNEALKKYFRAMQWLQLAPYCLDNEIHVKESVFTAALLNASKTSSGKSLITVYRAIFEPIIFLIGEPDNLSVMDIADYLAKTQSATLAKALDPSTMKGVMTMLNDLLKTRNRIRPKIVMSCLDRINFMPARYLVDNEVLQELVDVTASSTKRPFPRGLDVFAALGSSTAMQVITDTYPEDQKWDKYMPEMKRLQSQFKHYKGWNRSVYNKWLESLLQLQQSDKSYPQFMQTPSWDLKNLNTSLASWTDLKHDAILYGEQPMAAECGGGGPPEPITVGFVEPNVKFWEKLSELITLTKKVLETNKLMTDDLANPTTQLNDYVRFLLETSKKELRKEKLSEQDYNTIERFGSSIEYFTLSVIDPDKYFDSWNLVEGPDRSVAVVADVYTRNVPGCSQNGILHEGVGNVNNIYVVVEIAGNLYLTKGAVFSYYEFVMPLNERLTDEEWQDMLNNGKTPAVPKWLQPLLLNETVEPVADERIFYSSGC